MDRPGFEAMIEALGRAWMRGHADAASSFFADDVDYADPRRYRFDSRAQLVPFFEPGPDGHSIEWHRILFDESGQAGIVEYTYVGHHRYHGAAIIEVGPAGLITRWREWQHLDDAQDWEAYLSGPLHRSIESP